jgi:hypothetical protein
MTQRIAIQRTVNFEHEKELVKKTLNLKEKEPKGSDA